MIVVFKVILILSIWVLGIKIVTAKDMILQAVGDWGEQKVNEGHKIFEAIIVCPFCMPSVHSVFGYAFAFGLGVLEFEFDWKLIIMWPVVVMGSSILSGFTWSAYQTMNKIKEKNEAEAAYYDKMIEDGYVNNN